jgi:hypothetical protein
MSEAKAGLFATIWVEVAGLFMVVLDFVNAFGFVPLHVLKPTTRITDSINMLFGTAACYSRESTPAIPSTSARNTNYRLRSLQCSPPCLVNIRGGAGAGKKS